jgi:hypothetical protein
MAITTEQKVEPAIDAGLAKALRTQQALTEPYMTSKSQLQSGITEAQSREASGKQKQEKILAEGAATGLEKETQAIRGAQETYQKEIEAEPLPAFIPTKDTAQDIAGLFSLISVIGAVVGKKNAQMALGNMNAMLEGHQKGRADLYKKERNEFDTNFKAMIKKHEEFRKKMEDAIKLAPRDKEKAMADAKIAAVEAGSDIVKAQLDRGYLADAYKTVDELQKGITKVKEAYEKETAAERRHRESLGARERQHRETLAAQDRRAAEKGTRGSASQETSLRVMQQDIGNAKYNLEDLKNLAEKTGKLPGGSVAFAQKFTGDMTSMLMRYAANQQIDEGLQASDALMLNLAFDIASAQSGGRGQLSDAKVRAVVSQMPLDEQPESTKATKWAALMTRVDEANKTLPKDRQVEIPESLHKYYMGSRVEGGQPSSGGHWEYRTNPETGKQQRRWVNG